MSELHVTVQSASNLYDAQMFGKQDPYCEVSVSGRTFRTRVHDNGGKNPKWGDTFVFPVIDPQVEQLFIVIKDSNWISDDFIGTCQIPLNAFLHGQRMNQVFPVNHGRRQRGSIQLSIQLYRNTLPGAYSAPPPMTQPVYPGYTQPSYAPQPYPTQPAYPGYQPHQSYYPPNTFQGQPGYPGYAPQSYPPVYPTTSAPYPPYQSMPPTNPGYPPGYTSSHV